MSNQKNIQFLSGGGEMGSRIRAFDWSKTSLGSVSEWSPSLRSALSICLNSNFPIAIYWGLDHVLLYNDSWSSILGSKHPQALGKMGKEVWPEIWDDIEPWFKDAFQGKPVSSKHQLLFIERQGYAEECYFDFTFTPVYGTDENVEGVLHTVIETTYRVINERALQTLHALGSLAKKESVQEVLTAANEVLQKNDKDFPFAVMYKIDTDSSSASQMGYTIPDAHQNIFPPNINCLEPIKETSDFCKSFFQREIILSENYALGKNIPKGAWERQATHIIHIPITVQGSKFPVAIISAALNPFRLFDEAYRRFTQLIADKISTEVNNVLVIEVQKERAEASIKIEESATQLRIALEAGELGTYDFYPQTGELIWSKKTKELFGLPDEADVDFATYLNAIHPDDKERTQEALKKAMDPISGGVYENDYRTIGINDGKTRWIKSKGKISFNAEGKAIRFTGVTQDITRQKELLTSLELQSLVLEKMVEGVSVSDANGIIILTNSAENKMFGYEPGELIGKPVTVQNAYDQEENERIVGNVIAELKLKGYWNGQWHNRKKDGSLFYTFSFITQVQINNESHFVCVQRDISEEKTAEEKLAYRTALLEAQNEAIPDAMLIVDTNGNMLSFNQHFVSLWNIPVEIVERKDDAAALEFAMTQLEDPKGFIELVNYYYKHSDLKAHDEVLFKDGRIIERYGNAVLGDDGRSYGWAWYFRDITERKKAEEGLKRFKHMADNATEPFILMREDGSFAYLNDLALERWGYTREEAEHLRVPDVDPVYNNEVFNAAFLEAQKGKLPQFETLHKRKDGSIYPVEINMGGLTLEGKPHMFAIARDITERKKMEDVIFASSEKIRNFILHAPVAMALYRGEQYVIEIVNEELLQIWNKPFEAVINKPVFEAMPEARGQGFEEQFNKVYTTGERFTAFGIPITLLRNGEPKLLYINIVYEAYKEADGTISGIVEVVTDVTEQVTATQKVEVSEQRFSAAIDAVQGTVWTNSPTGEMEGEQPGWSALTGQSYKEYHGYGWASAVHPDDAQPTIEAWNEAVQEKKTFVFEHRLQLKNGAWATFSIRAIPLLANDGSIREWVGVHTDITEQRKAETELKNTKEQLELTFANVPAAIYLFGKKGEILFTNLTGAELMGYETAEKLLAEKDYAQLRKRTTDTFEILDEFRKPFPLDDLPTSITYKTGETAESIVLVIRKSDRKEIWLLIRSSPLLGANGVLEMVITTSTDISPQKTSEEAIRESEEKFRTLTETLPQLVWMRDKNGAMEYSSKSWEEYSGIKNTSDALKVITHPEDWEPISAVWEHAQAKGMPFTYEVRLKNKEGKYRWHHAVGEPVKDNSGNIIKWIGALTDIDIQKTFAEELEALVAKRTRELERSNNDLQQFAHVASHDLKEPIRKIKTFINLLESEFILSLPEEAKLYVKKIQGSADRMKAMVEGVLLYSSLNSYEKKFEKVDLNPILQSVLDELEIPIKEKNAVIEISDLPQIEGISVLLYQLFYNLINNSLKFSSQRPVIKISSRLLEQHSKDYIEITVADNGIGFAEEDVTRIFETFIRLNSKDRYEGSGIGLALSKKIAERHHGKITANGKKGEGASFVITLPLKQ